MLGEDRRAEIEPLTSESGSERERLRGDDGYLGAQHLSRLSPSAKLATLQQQVLKRCPVYNLIRDKLMMKVPNQATIWVMPTVPAA